MASPSATAVRDGPGWHWLAGGVLAALLVRLAFFTGYYGSDEVTYTSVAIDIAAGNWNQSTYLGALRYGINLPNALFIKVFGANELSANLWSLLCSVGEVALVFVFAHRLWGLRAALLSATVIGLLPLHVNLGGRLLADAPLAFFITLSLFLFWNAERRQAAGWYFAAGLAAGFVYWVKESVVMYGVVFALYALVYRTWSTRWLWAVLGGVLMILVNSLLMWAAQGDPLHIQRIMRVVTSRYVHEFAVESSPWFYARYLLADLRHTWIAGYLALGGLLLWSRQALLRRAPDAATGYIVLWALGLFAVFSFLPISLKPLTFLAKQTNYMAIFVAPFCMLAGYFLASLSRRWLIAVLGAWVAGAVVLSGLQQQAIHVFTANSKAAVQFARGQGPLPVYAGSNAFRAETYSELLHRDRTGKHFMRPMRELVGLAEAPRISGTQSGLQGYAVFDLETASWGRVDPLRRLADVPPCWRRLFEIEPYAENAPGYYVARSLLAVAGRTPAPVSARLTPRLEALVKPRPAYAYAIPAGCVLNPPGAARK